MVTTLRNITCLRNIIPILLFLWLSLLTVSQAAADTTAGDTEIYGVSTASIHPNVLIIFDNSGSMNGTVRSAVGYDPTVTYAVQNACGGAGNTACETNRVYRWRGVEKIWQPHTFLSSVQTNCARAYNFLSSQGTYTGRLNTAGACSTSYAIFATGNYINFLKIQAGVLDPTTPKITIAKRVVTDLLQTTHGVDFGVMVFNTSQGGYLLSYGGNTGISDMDGDTDIDGISNRDELITAVNAISATTWTPLAETLYEAGLYFKGAGTAFNGSTTYTSPITYSCQKNYVILMTDGMSTEDRDPVLQTICTSGDCDGDRKEPGNYSYQGSDYLDDVAKYLHDSDLRSDLLEIQNLTTFTIGFGIDAGEADQASMLLRDAATNGGGHYYSAYDTHDLSEAFSEILGEVIEDNTSFVAPVIPLNPENRTFSGNELYLGFFKPNSEAFWAGNIKKYGIDMANGTVVDRNNVNALDSSGNFLESSVSYWSSRADGGRVDAGGVGEVLLNRMTARNLYTYLGTSTALTNSSNALTATNPGITTVTLDVTDDATKNKVINFIHGYDVYGADPTSKREWILGDVLHSRPLIIHYSATRSVIFAGANDGMLHAFENSDGSELWGFVPPDMLKYLKSLTLGATPHPYYVDGSPKAYIKDANGNGIISVAEGDQVILIFGERRGGRAIQSSECGDGVPVHRGSYYALDVTDPATPVLLWHIGPPLRDLDADPATIEVASVFFSCEMGETWSEPVIGRVKINGTDRHVFFVGGGYDETSQDLIPPPADIKGRALFAIDVFTGLKVWEYSKTTSVDNDTGNAKDNMTYAVPSAVTAVDSDGNHYVDRIYVGDVGGQMWRFDVGNNDTANWTGKILFRSNPGADGSTGRKILFPPDYVQEISYDVLFFGSGDREHPRNTTVTVDRLYAVKDNSAVTTPLIESDLKDVTDNLLQSLSVTAGQQTQILTDLANAKGWLIKLDQHLGEKVVSPAAVFAKVAYYTTYSPEGGGGDPCEASRGTARVYAVNYLTGEAVFNYDTTNDANYDTVTNIRAKGDTGKVLGRSDRLQDLGSGIPSGVVIIINETGEMGLIGVGGGLDNTEVQKRQTSIRIYWRTK